MEFEDWTRAFVIMGDSPVGWKAVLLAEDGSMYALLQGMTPGDELRTVRLDDDGRISAFIIDSTDAWGHMLSIGNAELAARLGSPVIYEQTGRVQFVETFEQGLALWGQASDGAGKAIALDPVYSRSGGYSAKLTGGRDDLRYAEIAYVQGISSVTSLGFAFACSSPTDFDSVSLMIYLWDGTHHCLSGINLNGVTDKIQVYDHDDDWQDILSSNPNSNLARCWFFVKFTIDPATGYYKEVRFNQQVENVSAYRFVKVLDDSLPQLAIYLRVTSIGGENSIVYFDDFIVTAAEP